MYDTFKPEQPMGLMDFDRAAMAAAVLQMMGFRNVLNMEGGHVRWEANGVCLVTEFQDLFDCLAR
ncbi:MAG: hypothetical protein K0M66_08245 [Thiobacillus sp.]|nr:hypothetical protein [Thiobacillus sp.]